MKAVYELIEARKQKFSEQAFFRRLEGTGPLQDVVQFFPDLAFFVMTFQDMLRLNEASIEDPALREVARRHRFEDAGHDGWFLRDLEEFGLQIDVRRLYSTETRQPRDTSYRLTAEILHAKHDCVRIALLHVLEATGDCIFSRMPGYLARAGYRGRLQYFSVGHHRVEQEHELHDEEHTRALERIVLAPDEREEALAVVHRAYDAMTAMVDFFEANIEQRRAS